MMDLFTITANDQPRPKDAPGTRLANGEKL